MSAFFSACREKLKMDQNKRTRKKNLYVLKTLQTKSQPSLTWSGIWKGYHHSQKNSPNLTDCLFMLYI